MLILGGIGIVLSVISAQAKFRINNKDDLEYMGEEEIKLLLCKKERNLEGADYFLDFSSFRVALPFIELGVHILFYINNMASITPASNESSNPIIFMITQC